MQRSATSRVRATASAGRRSAASPGGRSTDSWLPRRSRSEPSSEVRLRIATRASWRRMRRWWWAWTSPVADRRHAERGGELGERGVPARVAALVRPLELDVERARETPAPGGRRRSGRRRRARGGRSRRGRRAPRRARRRTRRVVAAGSSSRSRPSTRVRGVRVGQDPAEVLVAAAGLAEQRDVGAAVERDLGAGDRAQPEVLGRMRELERSVDPVVVGERERVVAELGRPRRELLGQRRPVEERVRRVRVQLDVSHRP